MCVLLVRPIHPSASSGGPTPSTKTWCRWRWSGPGEFVERVQRTQLLLGGVARMGVLHNLVWACCLLRESGGLSPSRRRVSWSTVFWFGSRLLGHINVLNHWTLPLHHKHVYHSIKILALMQLHRLLHCPGSQAPVVHHDGHVHHLICTWSISTVLFWMVGVWRCTQLGHRSFCPCAGHVRSARSCARPAMTLSMHCHTGIPENLLNRLHHWDLPQRHSRSFDDPINELQLLNLHGFEHCLEHWAPLPSFSTIQQVRIGETWMWTAGCDDTLSGLWLEMCGCPYTWINHEMTRKTAGRTTEGTNWKHTKKSSSGHVAIRNEDWQQRCHRPTRELKAETC